MGGNQRNRLRIILAVITVPLLIATVVGMIWLWPRGDNPLGTLEDLAEGTSKVTGTVTDLRVENCVPGAVVDESGLLAAGGVCVKVTSGQEKGKIVPVAVAPEFLPDGMKVGDPLQLLFSDEGVNGEVDYVFWDFKRGWPIGLLALLYLALVTLVAGRRGLAAIGGLLISLVVVVGFMIPAILTGASPVAVAVVGGCAMIFASVYPAHGISIRTTTALLGTLAGLLLTVGMASVGVNSAHLTGANEELSRMLLGQIPGLSARYLLIAGVIIASLGALNDVTITQASAVWELAGAAPNITRWQLWRRAMRIGRDHIASTVYTLAFAFVGTALPLLSLALMIDRSLVDTLLTADIAEEIVRTLVASIGLICAIPATTALGVALVFASRDSSRASNLYSCEKPLNAAETDAEDSEDVGVNNGRDSGSI